MINRTRRSFTAFMLVLSILLTTIPVSSTGTAVMDAEALSRESQIFNYVHREVFEENAHVQRLAAEESLDSYVFLNADGSRTAYFLDEPVKFVDSSGAVREKDITLTYAANTFTTTSNNVALQIPTNLSTGVRLSYGDYDVSIVPQGSSLTLPRLSDNSVVYDNYFGTGTKLIYTPTLDGVKEDIVLTAYRGVSSFTFLLNTDGLRVYHTAEDRWYLAEHEEAELRFWLGNVEVFDANLKPSLGTMTVEPITEGQRYRLTISANPGFLADPATAYPVTIDPTITVSDNANGAGAIEDAPIYEGYPTSNFGTYQYNRAGYGGTAYKRGRTVVKLTGLLTHSVISRLPASCITSVTFHIADATGGAGSTVKLYPLNGSSWSESSVTWNNIGSYRPIPYGSKTVGNGTFATFDITSLVQKWKVDVFDAEKGFILIGTSENSVDRSLYSSEHSTTTMRPYIRVTYYDDLYYSSFASSAYFCNTESGTAEDEDGNEIITYLNDGLQRRSNCYAYAFRFYYSGSIYNLMPGEIALQKGNIQINSGSISETILNDNDLARIYNSYILKTSYVAGTRIDCMFQLMAADMEALNLEIEFAGYSYPGQPTDPGKRLIAVVIGAADFHFYMQHSDGSWSHKPGHNPTSTKCFTHQQTLQSSTIDSHIAEGSYLAGPKAYFYINKNIVDTMHN